MKVILLLVLLLASLVDYTSYAETWSFYWNGSILGAFVFAIMCLVLLRQVVAEIRAVSKVAGLDPTLPRTSYDALPWLFFVPWMIGMRFVGEKENFESWGDQYTWEFLWGDSLWKLAVMAGLILVLYLFKLKKRILELQEMLSDR